MADETMYRQIINLHSLKVQLINALIELDIAVIQNRYRENLEILQENFKNVVEGKKVDSLNYVIVLNNMLWRANRNPVSDLTYKEKEQFFGENYNLLGLDYYSGGIYDGIPGVFGPNDNSELNESFDWRNRHGANDPDKDQYYYDGDPDGGGWMTDVKNQDEFTCSGLCYIYAPLAAVEGLANLYFNIVDKNKDYDLSEQNVLDCDNYFNDQCVEGYSSFTNSYLYNPGVLDEACYNRMNLPGDCQSENPPDGSPVYRVKIAGTSGVDLNSEAIKSALIHYGPLPALLEDYYGLDNNHFMALVGYGRLKAGDKFYIPGDPPNTPPIIVTAGSDYIGKLYWIFKNSKGQEAGDNGYFYHLASDTKIIECRYYNTPIDDILTVYDTIIPLDKDLDGYWNWGISENYDLPEGVCSELKDSDDSENRIGPFDNNYFSIPVKPEMEVSVNKEFSTPDPVHNHGFYFFQENNCTLKVAITNPGSARLNLSELNTVEIFEENHNYYQLQIPSGFSKKVCMEGGTTSFDIHFSTTETDETITAKVKIALNPCDADVFDYFEFELVYNGCDLIGEDHNIDGYEAWNDYNFVPNDIYIKRGGIMEVFGSLAMFEHSDIYVEAGGELIVNRGLITKSCNALWNGIDVLGDVTLPQMNNYQGRVTMINGGCIEYAQVAIETAYHPEPRRWRPSGGIIYCADACFRDNEMDIEFFPYHNTHPVTHELLPNFSRLKRTRFETTKGLYLIGGSIPSAHVLMDNVEGLNFQGCSFINSSGQAGRGRGKGIESYTSGYYISSACREDNIIPCPGQVPCRFEGLDYGIRAFNTNTYSSVTIDSADFINNLRGVHLILVEHLVIIKSTFEIDDPEGYWPGEELVGLYLDQFTTGFKVEENKFTGPATISSSVGIHLLNTGTDQNEIYNNSFASLYHGIAAVGINRLSDKESEGVGLCIKCNDFQQCRNDVYVTYETDDQGNPIYTENTGIAQKQGVMNEGEPFDNTLAAGNTFSIVTSANYFNNEHCGQIEYSYHGNNFSEKKIIPYPIWGIDVPKPDPPAIYTKIGSCPSHFGGSINLTFEKSILNIETGLISASEDTLIMVTDGGNTEGLNYEVLTSYPEEALVIRQELIEESPFLSDTVMISAIEKENVLPGAMIRDVLVQNPQAPKSKKVMDALDQRQDSIPDYMMEEILQGLNMYGAKELMEQELGNHIAKRDQAWKNLNLFYKHDTLNIENSIDSLIALQEADNRLSTQYDLAFMHLYVEDSIDAFGALNDIPSEFELTAGEASTHNHFMELFNILWDVKHDTTGLDSLQTLLLFDLAESYQTIPGLYASNLLIKASLLNYKEPVYLADPVKNILAQNKLQVTSTNDHHLSLFPNPAGNYFIACYYLNVQQYPGILTISDINGIEIKSFHLKDKQNQIVIPTQELSAGAYIVSLIGRNHLIASQKLTIIR